MDHLVCTVVGAGPGLGRAVAERFARSGYRIGLIARDERKLGEFADSLAASGAKTATASADAGDDVTLRFAISKIEAELGATSVLVYNAVAFTPGLPSEITAEVLNADFRVNVTGALTAAQAVIPKMKSARGGTILLTGGGLALHPNAQAASLSLGKTGIRCLAFMLAQELQPTGIRVVTFTISGYIQTGTHFDPHGIADVYYQAAVDGGTDVEIIYK